MRASSGQIPSQLIVVVECRVAYSRPAKLAPRRAQGSPRAQDGGFGGLRGHNLLGPGGREDEGPLVQEREGAEGDGGEGEYDQDFEDDFEREDEDSGADGQRGSGSGGVNSAEGADDVGEDNGFEQVEVSASDGGSGGIVDDYGDDDFDVASGGGGGNSFGGSPEDDDGLIEDDLASDNEDDF